MDARIHPTAIVDRHAELASDVVVGPYSVIGPRVQIARGTRLMAHVVIEGPTSIGRGNVFFPFSVVGCAPQHKRDQGGPSSLVIGDDNVVREHVTIHLGTRGGTTRVGNANLLMVGCHVAHDATVGDHVAFANSVQLAGHAVVGDYANFGGLSGVAQFVNVGQSAFVAAGAMCERDVPPFVIVQGDRARVRALNRVGLERRGIPAESIAALEKAYRAIFVRRDAPRAHALAKLDRSDRYVAAFIDAIGKSARAT